MEVQAAALNSLISSKMDRWESIELDLALMISKLPSLKKDPGLTSPTWCLLTSQLVQDSAGVHLIRVTSIKQLMNSLITSWKISSTCILNLFIVSCILLVKAMLEILYQCMLLKWWVIQQYSTYKHCWLVIRLYHHLLRERICIKFHKVWIW